MSVLPGKKYRPDDFARIAWRQKWTILLPFLAAVVVSAVISQALPNRYRSEASMVLMPARVPESYVRSTVSTGSQVRIEDRLQSLRQEILSRTRLEVIIRELDLYPSLRANAPMEDVVDAMRRDVAVDVVRENLRVAYVSTSPRTAQKVAERLASLVNEANVRERSVLAEATTDFLQSQLDEARRRLQDHEQKLAEYQRRHAGELPTERDANLQALNSAQLQVTSLGESLNRDRDRRLFLERQIADLNAEIQASTPVPPAQQPAAPPGAPVDPTAVGGLSATAQLAAARETLRTLELRLTPDHPDIRRLKGMIRDLEAQVKAEDQARSASPSPQRAMTAEESARLNRLKEMRAEIQDLDIRIATKQRNEERLREQIGIYQARLNAIPNRESELTALTRDYETLKKTYDSLLNRQQESRVAADLERRQIGEQFRMVDAPRVPQRPFSPNRPLINLAGAFAGLGLGLGIVAFLEYRDTSLRTEDDVVTCLALPVLALIPRMGADGTAARAGQVRARVLLLVLAGGALLAALLAAWRFGFIALVFGR